jgi:hypothetical protein
MSSLVLAALLVAGFNEVKVEDAPKVEGKWLIVYAEEAGRRNNAWEQQQATVEGTKLSYEAGGKQHTLELKFGKSQTLHATGGGEGDSKGAAWNGVYVSSQDFFVVSLNREGKAALSAPAVKEPKPEEQKEHASSSGTFILILRRQR